MRARWFSFATETRPIDLEKQIFDPQRRFRALECAYSTVWAARNKKSSVKKARLRFFVFFNNNKTAKVALFNSHKKGKEPHPGLLLCVIF